MSKLDKIIALMDAHHFKNLKEICEIPVHKAAIEAIINEQPSEEIVQLKAEIEALKEYNCMLKLSIQLFTPVLNKLISQGEDSDVQIKALKNKV